MKKRRGDCLVGGGRIEVEEDEVHKVMKSWWRERERVVKEVKEVYKKKRNEGIEEYLICS